MCCSSVLLGFQRERRLFLPHLCLSRGGDGKASFLPSAGLTNLSTWSLSVAQTHAGNDVLSGGGEGEEGKARRSFSSRWVDEARETERLVLGKADFSAELIGYLYLNNKCYLQLLLVLKSFQVMMPVDCVVTRLLKVWVKPSISC